MKRDELGDLVAFLAVAEERSFTRAAAQLGTSQSSLSHTVRRLEERMGLRLLTRTTRNVVPTEAGEQLMETLRPAFDDIRGRIETLGAMRQQPGGTIRITSSRHAAETIIMPAVKKLMADYPDIIVEISIDQRFVDLVAERYDAGVRLGESIEKDMVAVRIGPELRMMVAGSPEYFRRNPKPGSPYELTQHNCINLRFPTLGGIYAWEFEQDGRPLNVRVEGQFICNDVPMIIDAALDGLGLACLPDDHLGPLVSDGRLVSVLDKWCPLFPGYHLYYPSRRLASPAFALLVDALRYRGDRWKLLPAQFGCR
jgi:DNA-binding transcriptional LysR family regulator